MNPDTSLKYIDGTNITSAAQLIIKLTELLEPDEKEIMPDEIPGQVNAPKNRDLVLVMDSAAIPASVVKIVASLFNGIAYHITSVGPRLELLIRQTPK